MKSPYFGRISCLTMAWYLLSFWEWYYYITVWGSPQTKETSFCPAVWDIFGWNWEDDHFHINWGGPRSTLLLPTLPLPTPCSSCGLCCWAKGASFDATSDEGSNLFLWFSASKNVPAIIYPTPLSPKYSSFCFSIGVASSVKFSNRGFPQHLPSTHRLLLIIIFISENETKKKLNWFISPHSRRRSRESESVGPDEDFCRPFDCFTRSAELHER